MHQLAYDVFFKGSVEQMRRRLLFELSVGGVSLGYLHMNIKCIGAQAAYTVYTVLYDLNCYISTFTKGLPRESLLMFIWPFI
jgi:hypothetical protein